jgi:hypothetical protein
MVSFSHNSMNCFALEDDVNMKLKLSRSWIVFNCIEVEFVVQNILFPKESELPWLSRAMVKQHTS